MTNTEYLEKLGKNAAEAKKALAVAETGRKDLALTLAAQLLVDETGQILRANREDVDRAAENGMSRAMLDRLSLTAQRVRSMSDGLLELVALPDPAGEIIEEFTRPNGLEIKKIRVPLGVLGIIYEARPNVTADAAGICIKSGNVCILRGGSEAISTNTAIADVFRRALAGAGLPENAVQLITDTSRETAAAFMKLDNYVDVLIPRGGAGLINAVKRGATVPVIRTGTGNCHVFVDASADQDMAENIIVNAKTQRPSVCNAMETLLIHADIAETFLPRIAKTLLALGVELRVCENSAKILSESGITAFVPATEEDWDTEYNDLILAVRVVDGTDEAIAHIGRYSTLHSEAIVTRDADNAEKFLKNVDAACVYVNASTRFTDGGEFGMGAEIGISTQKLHARGPMGLKELTTIKYLINGNGQVRK